MEKSKLYTRTGDTGTTSLVGGQRAQKDDVRLEAYGTVDEFSAHLGLLLANDTNEIAIQSILRNILNRLFNVGAYLATAPEPGTEPQPQGLTDDDVKEIEQAIDALDAQTPKVNSFVLPAGTEAASQAHIARTVCRRAERRIVALSRTSYVAPIVLTYFNRLSDFLFILARFYNFQAGIAETLWSKE
ncbi:MAG: cob(I)yrinic acid a,c-diamide adenosyltransferase [Muribaculaceae bacterium]|nr:cob(I)yrinic acid a,c-diamide adenosyltransferase [Muribaculaceae bacterium]